MSSYKENIIKHLKSDWDAVEFLREEQSSKYGLMYYFSVASDEINILGGDFWISKNINKYKENDLGCHMEIEKIEGEEYIFCWC